MGLYAVPQTAVVTDPVVAAAVARFRLRAPKPEAFATIADDTIALHLEEGYDAVGSALGDRATLPLLQVDARLDGAAMRLACRTLMADRGYNRDAGTDDEIAKLAEMAEAFLARCRPSGDANGKTENPRYIDSGGNQPLDAPFFTSAQGAPGGAATADAWIDARAELAGGYRG